MVRRKEIAPSAKTVNAEQCTEKPSRPPSYDGVPGRMDNPKAESVEFVPTKLSELALQPRRIICPGCLHTGNSAVIEKRSKVISTVASTLAFIVGTLGIGILFLKPMLPVLWETAKCHATHFCGHCGIRLAYWNGDTQVCAGDDSLTASTDAPAAVGTLGCALSPARVAKSPLNAYIGVPSPDERIFARKNRFHIFELKTLTFKTGSGCLPERVVDGETGNVLFELPTPQLEAAGYYIGEVFLPHESSSSSWFGSTGGVDVLRCRQGAKKQAASLWFRRDNWRLDVTYYPANTGLGSFPHTKFGVDDDRAVIDRLFFLFMGSEGPLLWTKRNGWSGLVLLDAYDRVVALVNPQGSLSYTGVVSEMLLEELLVTYLAISIQKQRYQDHLDANSNENAQSG
ncbi:putative LITAF domain-containing protein [Seiridium unicorne]|uniref:LITAF domain-containing protein n=1 Tax=Seiridium unicorne TaxID=138068 RepID=A0ABR2V8S0_9PEZI